MEILILIQSIFLFFAILIMILLLLMIISILRHKVFKNKEEFLILINQISTIVFLFIYIIYIIFWYIKKFLFFQEILYKILNYSFNIYIIILYGLNYMISVDNYYTYKYPVHFFSYLLKINSNIKNYNAIIGIFIIFITFIFDFLYCEINYIKKNLKEVIFFDLNQTSFFHCEDFKSSNNINIYPFILINKYKGFILIALCLLTIFYLVYALFIVQKFYFKKNESLKIKIIIQLIISLFLLLYSIANTLEKYTNFDLINSSLFIFILLINNLFFVINYCLSRFVQFKLKKSLFGKVGLFLNKFFNKKENFIPLTYSTENIENISSYLLIGNSYNFSDLPLNNSDQELILMYQNDIFLEDYYLNYFDQFLNIITSSLYKLYDSEIFSPKVAHNKKLNKEMNISLSSIPGGNSGTSGINYSNISDEINITENISSFTFYRNKLINDFCIFEEVLNYDNNLLNKNDLRVNINSYYTDSCVNNIFENNLSSKNIAKSLISHMIIKNPILNNTSNLNQEELPSCNYHSLTVANAKELHFKNLRNICFKTYDKKYTLEIFETNEIIKDLIINSSNKKNNDINKLIKKYFIYLEAKGINNTFLPLIFGIFKIKINNFKSLIIIVTQNSVVENSPIKNFTNWQFIRFKEKGLTKIGSSRYSRNTIVSDDLIFKRVYWKEKKWSVDCKLKLYNYQEIKTIILSDINFLKNSGCNKFNLLLMYYEYESSLKQESYKNNEFIKIKNNSDNEPEIITGILPNKFLYDDSMFSDESDIKEINEINKSKVILEENNNIDINNIIIDRKESKISKNNKDIQLITDDISDDNNILGKEIDENSMKFSDEYNFKGYRGIFDNFNCMCFFSWENIFENLQNYSYKYDFYKNFMKKIMKYLTSLKENENEKDIKNAIN